MLSYSKARIIPTGQPTVRANQGSRVKRILAIPGCFDNYQVGIVGDTCHSNRIIGYTRNYSRNVGAMSDLVLNGRFS